MTFLNLPINPVFTNFFITCFYNFFFIYIKMSKNLSFKYYEESNERIQKKVVKNIKIFLKKEKKATIWP